MAALITGGTGFIGAEIARVLLSRGESCVAVFSRSASTQRFEGIDGRIDFVKGDVGHFSHVLDAVRQVRPDVIYHFGAMLSVPSEADPAGSIQTNAMGTFHVLEAARMFGVPKVIFASTTATFGLDIQEDVIGDLTLQRPSLLYGATKLFGEHLGLFYRRKHGLDFRGLRLPSVVGPGVKSPAIVQYTSWVIEESAKGNPFTIWVKPYTEVPIVYYRDAARASVELAEAPADNIKTVNYLIDGVTPTPSAGELAEAVQNRAPGARIDFDPDLELQVLLDEALAPLDDGNAHREWNWSPEYDLGRMLDDFIVGLESDAPHGG